MAPAASSHSFTDLCPKDEVALRMCLEKLLSTSLNTFGVSHYCLLVIHFLPELSSQGAPGNLGTFLSDR